MASKQKNRTELISKSNNMHNNYTTPEPIKLSCFCLPSNSSQTRKGGQGGGGGGGERKWKKSRKFNKLMFFFFLGWLKNVRQQNSLQLHQGPNCGNSRSLELPQICQLCIWWTTEKTCQSHASACLTHLWSRQPPLIKAVISDQGSHLWSRQPPLIKAVTADQGSHRRQSPLIKAVTSDQGSHCWSRQSTLIKAVISDQGSHLWSRQSLPIKAATMPLHQLSHRFKDEASRSDSYIYPQLSSNKLCYTDNCL